MKEIMLLLSLTRSVSYFVKPFLCHKFERTCEILETLGKKIGYVIDILRNFSILPRVLSNIAVPKSWDNRVTKILSNNIP